jgi:hypothetical protein
MVLGQWKAFFLLFFKGLRIFSQLLFILLVCYQPSSHAAFRILKKTGEVYVAMGRDKSINQSEIQYEDAEINKWYKSPYLINISKSSSALIELKNQDIILFFAETLVEISLNSSSQKAIPSSQMVILIEGKLAYKSKNKNVNTFFFSPNHIVGLAASILMIQTKNQSLKILKKSSDVKVVKLAKNGRILLQRKNREFKNQQNSEIFFRRRINPETKSPDSPHLIEDSGDDLNTKSKDGGLASAAELTEAQNLFGADTNENTDYSKGSTDTTLSESKDKQNEEKLMGSNRIVGGLTNYFNDPKQPNIDQSSHHFDANYLFSRQKHFFLGDWKLGGFIDVSNRKDTYRPLKKTFSSRNEKRTLLEITELNYQAEFSKFDFLIGKNIVTYGKSTLYSPIDRLMPVDQTNPTKSRKLGNWMLGLGLNDENYSLSFHLLPFFIPSRSPGKDARWSFFTEDVVNFSFQDRFPENKFKNFQYLTKVETTFKGIDLVGGFFYGPNQDPVFKKEVLVDNSVLGSSPEFIFFKEYPLVNHFFTGLSTTFGSLEVHGEFLKQVAEEGKDDNYQTFVAGARYTFDQIFKTVGIQDLSLVLEFAEEHITQKQNAPTYVVSSINSRVVQRSLLGNTLINFNNEWYGSYDYQFDLENKGQYQFYTLGFRRLSGGDYRLTYQTFDGPKESLFGKWKDNQSLYFESSWYFL